MRFDIGQSYFISDIEQYLLLSAIELSHVDSEVE